MPGQKITLAQAQAGNAVAIDLCCFTPLGNGNLCRHEARFSISELIAFYGPEMRLDGPRWKCSVCGGFEVDVRPWFGKKTVGGLSVD